MSAFGERASDGKRHFCDSYVFIISLPFKVGTGSNIRRGKHVAVPTILKYFNPSVIITEFDESFLW